MEKIEIKKLTENGVYKYIGFNVIKEAVKREAKEDEKIVETVENGMAMLTFKDENEDVFFILSKDIKGDSYETPYGHFRQYSGSILSFFKIEIDEEKQYNLFIEIGDLNEVKND